MRRALRKDNNQSEIVQAFEGLGATVHVLHEPLDLLVGYRQRTFLVEVKRPDKRGWKSEYTPAQIKFRQTWRGQMETIYTAQEAVDFLLSQG